MRTSADNSQQERASLQSCCSASSVHGRACTEAQRLGLLACLATSNFKSSLGMSLFLVLSFRSPAPKMRTSAYISQPEGASLESFCSASSAHGTACTESQRLGLFASLVTSIFKLNYGGPLQVPPAALLQKCERLQIARSQKRLAWKAIAKPHLPMAVLTQRVLQWGCLLVFPLQK